MTRALAPFPLDTTLNSGRSLVWTLPLTRWAHRGPYILDVASYDSVLVDRIRMGEYDVLRQTVGVSSAIKADFLAGKALAGPAWEPGMQVEIHFRSFSISDVYLHACWWAEPNLG